MSFKHVALALTLGTASVTANATLLNWGHGCGGGNEPACAAEWSDSWTGKKFLSADKGFAHSWNYTFDITDDGFNVGEDTITSYELSLKLADDGDKDYIFFWPLHFEEAKLLQPGDSVTWEVNSGTKEFSGSADGVASLNNLGQLVVSLIAKEGDFWLKGAELIACGIDNIPVPPPVSVPEPSSLALLGLGLLGLGVARRNQRKA